MTPGAESVRVADSPRTQGARFDDLLDTLTVQLNALHGTAHPRRFWGILLYRYLCKCIRVHDEQLPLPELPAYVGNDDAILDERVSDAVEAGSGKEGGSLLKSGMRTLQALAPVRRLSAGIGRLAGGGSDTLVTGFHRYDVIMRRVQQPAERLRVQKGNWRLFGEPAKRRAVVQLRERTECPLTRLALDWLPCWYVEEFDVIYRGIDVPRTSTAHIHASFLSSIEVRMATARHVQAGARLSIYQHSGGYGETLGHLLYHAESTLADSFMTWGWKIAPSDRPYLALRLMKPAPRVDLEGPWTYVIGRQPMPANLVKTLSIQRRFFAALGDRPAAKVVVRPRTNKGGSWRLQVADEVSQRVRGVDEGRGDVAGQGGLLILDTFPTTTFMECMTGGIPAIAIVPEGARFTDIARPFYEEFLRIGLLHASPESAAGFLNGDDVARWWRGVQGMACFQDYLHTFCNCDETRVAA